jgi:hypothetical protein
MNNEDYINMSESELRKICNIKGNLKGVNKCDKMSVLELQTYMYNMDKIYKSSELYNTNSNSVKTSK